MRTFVCRECGSDDVHVKAWVKLNSHEFIAETGEMDDTFCNRCDDYCETIDENRYVKDINCGKCSGTGLGMYEGGSCTECHGRGYFD